MANLSKLLLAFLIALSSSVIAFADKGQTSTKNDKVIIIKPNPRPLPSPLPTRPHMPAFVPYSCWMDDEYIYVESLGECGYATVTIETADGTVIATDIIDDTDPATPTVTLPAPLIPGDYSITITTESGAIYSGEFFYN